MFELEETFASWEAVTGIDEAGRGCLAGPVVTASVTWSSPQVWDLPFFKDLADSKTLAEPVRERLYPDIVRHARRVRVAVLGPALIDSLNILQATLHGFEMVAPDYHQNCPLLIDGNRKPRALPFAETVVKGDGRHSSMAAAGIVAKVTRDRLMKRAAGQTDPYGFKIHKGYATARHRDAIKALGPGPLHRKSFSPVKLMPQPDDTLGLLLLDQLRGASKDEQCALWASFQENYHLIRTQTARLLIDTFQAGGLSLLPTPACRDQWSTVGRTLR